jgi:acetylornithine deacetylase
MLTPLERRVADAVAARRDDIVDLASALIRFDTTSRGRPDERARDETALQELLAERLRRLGAAVDVWEPAREDVAGHPLEPEGGIGFEGRPQLAARLPGRGGGRSLLLNGHIDVVSAEPQDAWTSPPFAPEVRDGLLFGRGSCDMKGGIAAMVAAAEVLADEGVALSGDLVVCTNTDEESSGVGALACARRGVRADGAIAPEPSGLAVWPACRGTVYATVKVAGREGHAEVGQPHWSAGGAVNAIEKAAVVLEAVRRLREEWASRRDLRHAYLSAPDVLATRLTSGGWYVTVPGEAEMTLAVLYLPQQADVRGWASDVTREVETAIRAWCDGDPWLREHPPEIRWHTPVNPHEVPDDDPLVAALGGALHELDRPVAFGGLDSWFDGATFANEAGTPAIMFGPRHIVRAHTVDEHVPVDDLAAVAQGIALTAMRFCGVAEDR